MKDRVKILQVLKYRGEDILIQQVGNIFQYIVFSKGKFYQGYNTITIPFYRRIVGKGYTEQEMQNIHRMLLTQAETTVDVIKS